MAILVDTIITNRCFFLITKVKKNNIVNAIKILFRIQWL
jgi:hypothetical protein